MTPRLDPCEVCRERTDRRAAVDQRPRHVFLCSDDCEQIFRMRLGAALEERRSATPMRSASSAGNEAPRNIPQRQPRTA